MEIKVGNFYFISNNFFEKVQDPYLKINYENTKRPHYFAFKDNKTGLYWLVPCSSKVEKFEQLIQKKVEQHKPTDSIKIVKVFNRKTVLLFQDMFPITATYIENPYSKGGQLERIAKPNVIQELEKNAKKIINLLHRGIHFTPTQPDVLRIEKIMLNELKKEKNYLNNKIIESIAFNEVLSPTNTVELPAQDKTFSETAITKEEQPQKDTITNRLAQSKEKAKEHNQQNKKHQNIDNLEY